MGTVATTEAKKPEGGADGCLASGTPVPEAMLMTRVLTRENLQRAWERIKANAGAPGVDGMTVEEFPAFVRSPEWASVGKSLEDGSYRPQPVRRVYIPNGKHLALPRTEAQADRQPLEKQSRPTDAVRFPRVRVQGQEDRLVGEIGAALQAAGQATDRPQLGRVDGPPAAQALGVSPGVDGVLRALGTLPPGAGNR